MEACRLLSWSLVFLVALWIPAVLCGGKVEIRLLTYDNLDGKLADGNRCDDFISGKCDHLFYVCLDNRNGSTSISDCLYGRIRTGSISGKNTIIFDSTIDGTDNPMVFSFEKWPGSMKLKVRIEDSDSTSGNDFVEFLQTNLDKTPAGSDSTAVENNVNIKNRTSLSLTTKVYCDRMYYGPDCTVLCEPRDDFRGHYTCDKTTGQKICIAGWTGLNCKTNIDDCVGNGCQNGGTCIDGITSYTCRCLKGFEGQKCETDKDECLLGACNNNAACMNLHGSYKCKCSDRFQGQNCSDDVNECGMNICENGAECVNSYGSYHCICSKGFKGQKCETDKDECLLGACNNNAACTNLHGSYKCKCSDRFQGQNCSDDVNECEMNICENGAECVNSYGSYHCICSKGFKGQKSNPCKNGGTCIDQIDNFSCTCRPGFNGTTCDNDINECRDEPCENNGICKDRIGKYECECTSGWTGETCQDSWAKAHWYAVLIIVAVVLACLAIPAVIVYKKIRTNKKNPNDAVQYCSK